MAYDINVKQIPIIIAHKIFQYILEIQKLKMEVENIFRKLIRM